MKQITLIFSVLFTFNLYPQISDITRLPFQSKDKEYFESTPVVISDNEILIFYCTGYSKNPDYWTTAIDTLYYSKSTNGGTSWSTPKYVYELGNLLDYDRYWYLTSLKTSSGRIIIAWSDIERHKVILMHSDDYGETWSDTTAINVFIGGACHLNIREIDSSRIILNFDGLVHCLGSRDDGNTWTQDQITCPSGFPTKNNVSFIKLTSKLLAFFEYSDGIYFEESTDDGVSWSEEIPLIDSQYREHNPRIIKYPDDRIVIYYLVDYLPENNKANNDIYSIQTNNGGSSWSNPKRFTRYAGDDNYIQVTNTGETAFIMFSTTRYTNKPQICFAKPGETIEKFRPPYIRSVTAASDSLSGKQWLIKADVIDDEKVGSVKVFFDDGSNAELFDDGLHSDGDSLDNLFANSVLLNYLSPSKTGVIDVNKLILPFNSKGVLADTRISFDQDCVFEAVDIENDECIFYTTVEGTDYISSQYEEGRYLFSGGLFLSGYTDGVLWSNAVASANLVEDYLPGIVGSNKNDPVNKIYVIYEDDPPFGYSWQRWKDAVNLGAEFYDGDKDGVYNPVDKNFNGTWELNEDMPFLLGDVTAWCVYNDAMPKEFRRWDTVDPQGIEIRQTVFASGDPELENVIFIRYSLLNTGSVAEVMDSVYFGVWEDADIGDAIDDVVGCDTILNSGFYYGNVHDWVYGDNPPSFFTSFLQGPVINTNNPSDTAQNYQGELIGIEQIPIAKNINMTSHIFNVGGDPDIGDPNSATEARNYLKGKTRTGVYPDPCTFPYCEVKGGVNCNEVIPQFWASGDPVTDIGWIDRLNVDHRNLISTGPFQLEKDKPQEIIIAYVIGRGTDYFNSITVARENVQRAIAEYESNFANMTYTPPPATNPVNNYVLYQNYPNPFNPTTTIRYELPQDGVVTIDVYDILGQKVKTILNEFKKADRYEVTFKSLGLASGVYIYQMRVNDFIISKKMLLIK